MGDRHVRPVQGQIACPESERPPRHGAAFPLSTEAGNRSDPAMLQRSRHDRFRCRNRHLTMRHPITSFPLLTMIRKWGSIPLFQYLTTLLRRDAVTVRASRRSLDVHDAGPITDEASRDIWHCRSPASSGTKTCRRPWPSCPSTGDRLGLSGWITAANSSPALSKNG